MSPLLAIRNLSVAFHHDRIVTEAVSAVSLDVHPGETVAIVGESGSGKTVTALSTVDLLPENARRTGSVRFQGRELIDLEPTELRRVRGKDICFVFQEPMTSLNPLHTLEKQIGEIIQLHNPVPASRLRDTIIELLDKTGIENPAARLPAYPHQFSGGQRQRIMIAMALANNPALLIADEPTTALDVTTQAQILALLDRLRTTTGMGLLFITHDLSIVRRIADRVYVMHQGEILEDGPTEQVFAAPGHAYTRELIAAEVTTAPEAADPRAPVVLETNALKVWYPIRRGLLRRTVAHIKAVQDCSLMVRQGHTLGIVGESGSGKTTLALALARLVAAEGSIAFDGIAFNTIGRKDVRQLRRQIQIVFQDPYGSLSPRLSVEEIVAEGLVVHEDLTPAERQARTEAALRDVGLDPAIMTRYPHEFSGGQRQRIALARSIILRPRLILFDEPTSALDRTVQTQILQLLLKLQDDHDLAYIFISHDLRVIRAVAHDVAVMHRGRIVEHADVRTIFEDPQHAYTRTLMAAAFSWQSSPDSA